MDDHDPIHEADATLLDAVREGSAPQLDAGAAARIADAAWSRATAQRGSGRPRWFPRGRLGLAAAAALVIAVGLYVLPHEKAAFAVEGEQPARVRREDGSSRSTRTVEVGDTVELPGGSRLVGRSGAAVSATRTSVFRITASSNVFSVALESGDLEVDGPNVLVVTRDGLRVVGDELGARHAVRVMVSGSLTASGGDATSAEVRVLRGPFMVELADQRLDLLRGDVARVVRAADSARSRLALARDWSDQSVAFVLAGRAFPVDATHGDRGSLRVMLKTHAPTHPFVQFDVKRDEVFEAIGALNALTAEFAGRGIGGYRLLSRNPADPPPFVPSTRAVTEYGYEHDGRTILVSVRADGAADLTDGDATATYADLGALRAARPDIADLFGARLGR